MYTLSAQTIIQIWEQALHQQPLERALTILAAALPQLGRDDLLALSSGQRDTYLLAIRDYTFGTRFAGFAECPQCQEHLEFTFEAANIRVGTAPLTEIAQVRNYRIEDYALQAHLPDSTDLLAIAGCGTVTTARELLLQRCIVQATTYDNTVIDATKLPESVISALGEQMLANDPQAEVQILLVCPACAHRWSALFDVTTFLWSEIRTHAKRLLREVHTLAQAYGWAEHDILAMNPARRQFYLEMVS